MGPIDISKHFTLSRAVNKSQKHRKVIVKKFGCTGYWTWGCWVRSKNATSVLRSQIKGWSLLTFSRQHNNGEYSSWVKKQPWRPRAYQNKDFFSKKTNTNIFRVSRLLSSPSCVRLGQKVDSCSSIPNRHQAATIEKCEGKQKRLKIIGTGEWDRAQR